MEEYAGMRLWGGRRRVGDLLCRLKRPDFAWAAAALFSVVLLGVMLVGALPVRAMPASLGPPVKIGYVERQLDRPPPFNNQDPVPTDEGLRGAQLGISDSNATGRFVGVSLELKTVLVAPGDDLKAAVTAMIARDNPVFVVVKAPAQDLLMLADLPEMHDRLLFNISAEDSALRNVKCRANVLHVAPSRDMLTDALVQFLVFKRWSRILLVSGPHEGDKLYATALRKSAKKFGAKIVREANFDAHGGDLRDSAMEDFLLVTRGPDHDVVAVADEANEFGDQLVYNTDSPRPVVGTQGLTPAAWGKPVEAWAAAQLQGRFRKLAGRPMRPIDYAGWMATHAVGEASIQLKSADPHAIRKLLISPGFEVGGFKGRVLSFRPWDGQLREPIYDLWSEAVVAAAPLAGFLHQSTDLDTLGTDAPETGCHVARG